MATEHHNSQKAWPVSWLGFVAVTLAIVAVFVFLQAPQKGGLVGSRAPKIEFRLKDGTQSQLSDYHGKAVLLNFWASWCGPCIEEMPGLRKLEDNHDDIVVLAFNMDEKEAEDDPLPLKPAKMPRTLIFDFNYAQLKPFGIRAIPISVLVDKEGVIKKVYLGPRDWGNPEIVRRIRKYIDS